MVHEQRIKNTLDQINCPASVFGILGGVSETRLSRAFRGVQDLTGPEVKTLTKVLDELVSLVQDARPYRLNLKNLRNVRSLLEMRHRGLRMVLIPLGPPELVAEFESEVKAQ